MDPILFKNSNLTIRYIEDDDYLLLRWNGFAEGSYFRFLTNQVLLAVEKAGTRTILSDNTHWKTISPNDRGWAANHWFTKAEEKGVRRLATVLSKELFHRMAERSIEAMAAPECMQIKSFKSMEEAEVWIKSSPKSDHCRPE